ncbi:MAG: MFS transporter [Burkholderiales bacterium]
MSSIPPASVLAPFRIRSFRYQWPADLATSWAFEMENLILGWYVLVETGSVLLLTVFASLLYIGTLLSPMFGVMADRVGLRNVLCAMRGIYTTLATTVMILAYTGVLTPVHVLVIAALMGLVRPSDIGMRAALVGETMPPIQLIPAMGIQRTTQDSARIAGALSGAGLVAALGMGPAYTVVATLYAMATLLTKIGGLHAAPRQAPAVTQASPRPSPWRDLKEGLSYVWTTPHLLAVICLAFLLNLTAFPLMHGLMPVVAKNVYLADRITLGYMVAGASSGALLGSLVTGRIGHAAHPARLMLVACGAWYVALLLFAQMPHPESGIPILVFAGCAQAVGQVPMSAILLRTSDEKFRGRIMGIRMLAIYGNLPGLLIAGPLIANYGYQTTATLYCLLGLAFVWFVASRWRPHLWRADALANAR